MYSCTLCTYYLHLLIEIEICPMAFDSVRFKLRCIRLEFGQKWCVGYPATCSYPSLYYTYHVLFILIELKPTFLSSYCIALQMWTPECWTKGRSRVCWGVNVNIVESGDSASRHPSITQFNTSAVIRP